MSAVSAVRANASVARSSFAKRSETRKLGSAPRSVTARAIITEAVADSPGADSALYDQFKKLLVDYEFSFKIGDRVSGKVFHCDSKGAWVDIGAKAAALCPAAESSLADVRNVSRPARASSRSISRYVDAIATNANPSLVSRGRRRRARAAPVPTTTTRFSRRFSASTKRKRTVPFRDRTLPSVPSASDPIRPLPSTTLRLETGLRRVRCRAGLRVRDHQG